jgi:NhaP-type Na+/H+ or K+/H+ antiporter
LDSVVLLFLLGVFLFVSPFSAWWAAKAGVWYLPYVLWLGLIVLIAWVVHRRHDDV